MNTYIELPSDCKGDGFDIAVAPHTDDKPAVEITPDGIVTREKIYASGAFCGYHTTVIDDAPPSSAKAVVVQRVTEANGAWKWAWGGRGRIRVAVVDTNRPHRQRNHSGFLRSLYESGSLCFGYAGGKYGYGDALDTAQSIAKAYAATHNLNLAGA